MAIRFDAAFLDKRMAAHKRWRHDYERSLLKEAIDEMAETLQMSAEGLRRAESALLPFADPIEHNFRRPKHVSH